MLGHRIVSSVLLALGIAATLTLFEPLKSAIANWDEITLGFKGLFRHLVAPFLWTALGLGAASALCTLLLGARAVAFIAALLICLVVQANFFVWDYGQFDGSPIDWSASFALGLMDAAFWAAVLALSLFKPESFANRASGIWMIALLFQVLSLGNVYLQAAPLAHKTDAVAATGHTSNSLKPEEDLFSFARNRNVFVIVLDTFQSDFFPELLRDPEFSENVPPGFTYYRNAVSTYPTTWISLANILTGRTAPEPTNLRRWRAKVMRASVPTLLALQGFETTVLVPNPEHLACNSQPRRFDCITHAEVAAHLRGSVGAGSYQRGEVQSLLGIATFRSSPHFLRPWVYADGSWRVTALYGTENEVDLADGVSRKVQRHDIAILRALATRSFVSDSESGFTFLHFFGAHVPYRTTRNCGWRKVGEGEPGLSGAEGLRSGAVDAAGCALNLTFDLMRRLEALGIYDNSLVFIVGDHGDVDVPLDLALLDPPIAGSGSKQVATAFSRGVPLFLVKRPGERNSLRVSDAPVSLCDIPASVFSELKRGQHFGCRSIFGPLGGRGIARAYLTRPWDMGPNPYGPLHGPFGHFRVEGHSWLQESWTRTAPGAPARKRR